jgi:lipopolysaccharide export system permease protein
MLDTGSRSRKYLDQQLTYKLTGDRIERDKADSIWTIYSFVERYIDNQNEHIIKGAKKDTVLNLKTTDLYEIKEDFEVMNFWELRDHIANEQIKGNDNVVLYEVEMNKRLASPAAILILTFIGVALSSRKVRGGIGVHLGSGDRNHLLIHSIYAGINCFCNVW